MIAVPTKCKEETERRAELRRERERQLAAQAEKRKELWSAINRFVDRNGGWVTSIPGDVWLTIETQRDSEIIDKLFDAGHRPALTGTNERIVGGRITPVMVHRLRLP